MLTFLVFMNFETAQQMIVSRYPNEDACGKDMPAKIAYYFPDGVPDRLFTKCIVTKIIGTSSPIPRPDSVGLTFDLIE